MSQDDETVERVAKHRLQHAMEMVRRDAAVTLTDADVFEMWGLCPSSERELLREALSALDRIVDFHIGDCPMTMEEIDFAKNINWQIRKTARAAADKIRAALTEEKQT